MTASGSTSARPRGWPRPKPSSAASAPLPPTHKSTAADITQAILAETPDIIINYSTGAVGIPMKERVGHIVEMAKDDATRPDLAPVDLGSFSLDVYDATTRTFRADDAATPIVSSALWISAGLVVLAVAYLVPALVSRRGAVKGFTTLDTAQTVRTSMHGHLGRDFALTQRVDDALAGLTLAQDPAVSFVEIINENGIIQKWYDGGLDRLRQGEDSGRPERGRLQAASRLGQGSR